MEQTSEEITLRKILDDRSCYDKYFPYLVALKNMTREMRLVSMMIKSYYDRYPKVANIQQQDFINFIKTVDKGGHSATIQEFVNNLFSIDICNIDLTLDIVESVVEKHQAAKILEKIAKIIDQGKSNVLPSIQDDIDEYVKILRVPPKDVLQPYKTNIGRLIKHQIKSIGLPFVTQSITNTIRGAREGTLGLIFAFVDCGKTSFGIANLCSMAHWIHNNDPSYDKPLIYAGNEEDEERIALRFTQAMSGYNNEQIAINPRDVKRRLASRGFDRIKILNGINHISHVERLCDKYAPRILIIDQGTKVKFGKYDLHDQDSLQELFNQYRELAKIHKCTIICLAQANAECDGAQWINLSHVYRSKVAIPGELDWAIGIGTNNEENYLKYRYFNICKNKFGPKFKSIMLFDESSCQFKEIKLKE